MGALVPKMGFANVPKLTGCVLLSFETFLVPPRRKHDGEPSGLWLEVFKLTYLNKNGFEQTYTWSEERNSNG